MDLSNEERATTQVKAQQENLTRHISRLEAQLEMRKSQLATHRELETILTARKEERDGPDTPEWKAMMARGKAIYGDAWDNPADGSIPLCELMTMHKDELDSVRHEAMDACSDKVPKRKPRKSKHEKAKTSIDQQNALMLSGLSNSPALVHPHRMVNNFHSQRKKGTPNTQTASTPIDEDDMDIHWSKPETNTPSSASIVLPSLDFTKLSSGTIASTESLPSEKNASHRKAKWFAFREKTNSAHRFSFQKHPAQKKH